MMIFGCCVTIDRYHELQKLGYKFIELQGTSIYEMSEDEFKKAKETIDTGSIKCLGFNSFLKPDIKIIGPNLDWVKINEYVDKVVERGIDLNIRHIGLGSPLSRVIEDSVSAKDAINQFCEFCVLVLKKMEKSNIKLLIEPLNKRETNFINNIDEAKEVIKRINHRNIGLVLDIYHFLMEKEELSALDDNMFWYLEHVHIADDKGRTYPKMNSFDKFKRIIDKLKWLGYEGGLSIEGNYTDFMDDAACSLKLFGNLME